MTSSLVAQNKGRTKANINSLVKRTFTALKKKQGEAKRTFTALKKKQGEAKSSQIE
jgi:hypothetical protein